MKTTESNGVISEKDTVLFQFRYATLGLLLGLLCMLGGFCLCLFGATSSTKDWTASLLGFHSSAADMPAGAMMIVAGVIVVFITRFAVPRAKSKSK